MPSWWQTIKSQEREGSKFKYTGMIKADIYIPAIEDKQLEFNNAVAVLEDFLPDSGWATHPEISPANIMLDIIKVE